MLEHGIIKNYMDRDRYGFIRVLGSDARLTGEEVFYHIRRARQVNGGLNAEGDPTVFWSRDRATLSILDRVPCPGDRVVFERQLTPPRPGRNVKVTRWTFQQIWDDEMTLALYEFNGLGDDREIMDRWDTTLPRASEAVAEAISDSD